MQRQQLYSFSFLETGYTYDHDVGANVGKPHKKRINRGVMVTSERTRKGEWVFKTRTNWDDEATTQMTGELLEGPDSTVQCTYFWNCMKYSAALCLLEELMEDAEDSVELDRVVNLLPVPYYGQDNIDYFQMISISLHKVKLKVVDNGYN